MTCWSRCLFGGCCFWFGRFLVGVVCSFFVGKIILGNVGLVVVIVARFLYDIYIGIVPTYLEGVNNATRGIVAIEGIIDASASGNVIGRIASENANTSTAKAGSVVFYQQLT